MNAPASLRVKVTYRLSGPLLRGTVSRGVFQLHPPMWAAVFAGYGILTKTVYFVGMLKIYKRRYIRNIKGIYIEGI